MTPVSGLTGRAGALAAHGRPPPGVVDTVRRATADTLAVALAARRERLLAAVDAQGADGGPAVVWHTGRASAPAHAALVNGTAAHALDYDDHCDALRGHPSAVLVPALLAVTREETELDAVADAYAAGFQVACALAAGVGLDAHYRRGWHATGTLLGVGAAAAVARLDGLDGERAAHAIALATSMAGGLRGQFGTDAKPLHAGLAARNGVVAARLAAAGVRADAAALEGDHGFLAVYGEPGDRDAAASVLDGPWRLDAAALNAKRHPCCGALQRTADAALAAAARLGERAGAVERVRVTMEPDGSLPLVGGDAAGGTEARFSAPYIVAAALADHDLGLASFTDEAVARPAVRALMRRVELTESAVPPVGAARWRAGFATLEAEAAGTVVAERVDAPRGHGLNPFDDDALAGKIAGCLRAGGVDAALAPTLLGTARRGGLRRLLAALAQSVDGGDCSGSIAPRPPSTGSTTPLTQRDAGLAR